MRDVIEEDRPIGEAPKQIEAEVSPRRRKRCIKPHGRPSLLRRLRRRRGGGGLRGRRGWWGGGRRGGAGGCEFEADDCAAACGFGAESCAPGCGVAAATRTVSPAVN